ncbi:hypothetical protein Q7C36_010964 [Tachysurus vachellii]|uniref:Ig-like domain-containing protein n=1 Tax=Tachysurus vachellii TaxID=175792 RepID=A0AA88SX90_TACVA|nr:hypothetical protein Q7C36_010964 [Tachysurus vachellii]
MFCELVKEADVEYMTVFTGESVVLPCVCNDLQDKPKSLKWEFSILTESGSNGYQEIYPEQTGHHKNRVKLVSKSSSGNLSLLVSDLTEQDQGYYRCSIQTEIKDFSLYVKGCDLSNETKHVYIGLPGGSVLLLCSCCDLHTKPHTFTWMSYRTGGLTDMLNDEHYRGRLQLFNNTSPGNLSLLISDLREEDGTDYRCITEKNYTDMSILGEGCDLSGDKHQVAINGHPGGSVLLPCSCSDLHTNPQIFTWTTKRTGHWTDVLYDELYRDRSQLFNHISPGNLSLLISDLREEDQRVYRCITGLKEYRDIRINVKGGRRETSTRSGKTDRRPPSEQPPSKTTNSPPASSSTTLKQGTTCVCTDLQDKPKSLKWEFSLPTESGSKHYQEIYPEQTGHHRNRVKLVSKISPGNLSLLVSDLTEQDQGLYTCSVQAERKDFRLYVEGGRRETSTRSGTTDRRPPSEQPPSKTTNSPPASSSTTLKQDKQQTHSSLLLSTRAHTRIHTHVTEFTVKCQSLRTCGENVITEGSPDCKGKPTDQVSKRKMSYNRSVSTFRAFVVFDTLQVTHMTHTCLH